MTFGASMLAQFGVAILSRFFLRGFSPWFLWSFSVACFAFIKPFLSCSVLPLVIRRHPYLAFTHLMVCMQQELARRVSTNCLCLCSCVNCKLSGLSHRCMPKIIEQTEAKIILPRRRTNVQRLTCNIDLSCSFYYLLFSFVLLS